MKATQAITASAAVAAIAAAFWNRHCRMIRVRNAEQDRKCMREAIETLEGEGGPVLS